MAKRLKESLAQGKLTKVFLLGHLCSPKIVEMVGLLNCYDAVWLDQEHPGLTLEQIEHGARAARGCGLDSFVRLPSTDYAAVMRPLEVGAGGVMASQIRNADQAEEFVYWSKFHPRGLRGVNGTGYDGLYGSLPFDEFVRRANAETFIAIQIERAEAVEDVGRIAAVKDVDVLFVGPADLSQSMGIPGEWNHPRMWQAIEKVAQAAKKNGIHWAVLPLDATYARRCVELGCRMLSLGIDVVAVQKGLKVIRAEYGEFLER